ncbi:MAG: hypothetical protein ACRCST_05565 [Turicibacter sp.]
MQLYTVPEFIHGTVQFLLESVQMIWKSIPIIRTYLFFRLLIRYIRKG